jgi:hypothetical protein
VSVLIEDVTLVVRRQRLELAYPGGVEAFLRAVRSLPARPRFACDHDGMLVNVSFSDADALEAAAVLLEAHWLIAFHETREQDFVSVDQRSGPTLPCSWLNWERFTNAFTVAWVAGSPPGPLVIPEGWTPPSPQLDLSFGADVEIAPAARPAASYRPAFEVVRCGSIHDAVLAALRDAGWRTQHDQAPNAWLEYRGDKAVYSCRYHVEEPQETVVCHTRAPVTIPPYARARVMEFVTRANCRLMLSAFELHVEGGQLFVRAACRIKDGVLTTAMVCSLAHVGAWVFDRYLPFLFEVVYGDRDVRDAVDAVSTSED